MKQLRNNNKDILYTNKSKYAHNIIYAQQSVLKVIRM